MFPITLNTFANWILIQFEVSKKPSLIYFADSSFTENA